VRIAITADGRARDLLYSPGAPRDTLASLGASTGKVGAAVTAYVDAVGYRLANGMDVGEPYALEMPELLLQAMRSAVESPAPQLDVDARAAATAP
jgi:pyruvate,water dikinase